MAECVDIIFLVDFDATLNSQSRVFLNTSTVVESNRKPQECRGTVRVNDKQRVP